MTKHVLLLAGVLLLGVAACDSFQTQVYQDDLVMPASEARADSLFYTVSLEYVTEGMTASAREKMNEAIAQQAFDLEDQHVWLEQAAIRYRENLIDEYIAEENFPATWEDRIGGSFTGVYKGWRNYQLSYYNFRGGAHGIQTVSQLVFDRKSGEVVRESDLFAPGYQAALAPLLQAAIQADMQPQDPELLSLVEMEAVAPNGNFSVGPDGIQWTFQPYEVGPFALGIVTATVSWKDVKPYLK